MTLGIERIKIDCLNLIETVFDVNRVSLCACLTQSPCGSEQCSRWAVGRFGYR